jgi:hypothetical protein
VYGIRVPATARQLDDSHDGYRIRGYTIQELAAVYKDWMSTDGWIFDAESAKSIRICPRKRPHIGYITQSIYVKPTNPPTTIAVVIGNFDGKPGNKRDLRVYQHRQRTTIFPADPSNFGGPATLLDAGRAAPLGCGRSQLTHDELRAAASDDSAISSAATSRCRRLTERRSGSQGSAISSYRISASSSLATGTCSSTATWEQSFCASEAVGQIAHHGSSGASGRLSDAVPLAGASTLAIAPPARW